MRVLIACEYSGRVREAFAKLGHDAWSVDLEPTDMPGQHFQGRIQDSESTIGGFYEFDLLIGHPPCTYLTNAAALHLYNKDKSRNEQRWEDMAKGAAFFNYLWNLPIPRKCLENPVMVGHAKKLLEGGKQTQIVHPYWFGTKETKQTCLWLKGLDPLKPTNYVKTETMALPYGKRAKVHYASPGKDRWKVRSTTDQGMADAMAAQWGDEW